jgi:hypothetical protein
VSPDKDKATLPSRAKADVAAIVASAGSARSTAVIAELAAMRKAFDAAAQSIEKLLALPLKADAEVKAFVDGLTRQFQAAAEPAADVDALLKTLQERDAQNQELRTLLVKARMDLEAARADLAAERDIPDTVRATTAELTGEFDRALDDIRREHATALAEHSAASLALPLDELLTVFNAMKKAETAPELISSLLNGLAREFSRVALFQVEGTRLIAVQRLGFEETETSRPIRLPVDSILTRAVSTGRLESVMPRLHGDPDTSLPFGGTPGCALAIPIVIQGTTAAVIYADDSDHVEFASAAPQVRVKFAELLQQYALLVLVRISVEQKTTQDLRGFAAALVAELEYTYTVEAEAGRNRLECQQRLKDALLTARKKYADRAAGDSQAAGVFDDQLAATLAAKKESAFGRDLASLLGTSRQRGGNIVAMFR